MTTAIFPGPAGGGGATGGGGGGEASATVPAAPRSSWAIASSATTIRSASQGTRRVAARSVAAFLRSKSSTVTPHSLPTFRIFVTTVFSAASSRPISIWQAWS